jgi:hypothetical protein
MAATSSAAPARRCSPWTAWPPWNSPTYAHHQICRWPPHPAPRLLWCGSPWDIPGAGRGMVALDVVVVVVVVATSRSRLANLLRRNEARTLRHMSGAALWGFWACPGAARLAWPGTAWSPWNSPTKVHHQICRWPPIQRRTSPAPLALDSLVALEFTNLCAPPDLPVAATSSAAPARRCSSLRHKKPARKRASSVKSGRGGKKPRCHGAFANHTQKGGDYGETS